MKNIIYGFKGRRVHLRPLNINGSFKSGSQKRYTVDFDENSVFEIDCLHLAFLQITKGTPQSVVKTDKNRKYMASKPRQADGEQFFYAATMCVIGMIVKLSYKEGFIDLGIIVNAVRTKNELWVRAVENYNRLFNTDDIENFVRPAPIFDDGRRALACLYTGLQIICDLIKESRSFKLDGRFLESAEIDSLLEEIGLNSMSAYLLLQSPKHPERELLLNIIDKYKNKYELCRDSKDNWVVVNRREIKRIEPISIKYYVNPSNTSVFTDSMQSHEQLPEDNQAKNNIIKNSINEQKCENNNDKLVESFNETLASNFIDNDSDNNITDLKEDVLLDKSSESIHNNTNPEHEQTANNDKTIQKDGIKQQDKTVSKHYSSKRERNIPSALIANQQDSASPFRQPQNKNTIPIDVDDI